MPILKNTFFGFILISLRGYLPLNDVTRLPESIRMAGITSWESIAPDSEECPEAQGAFVCVYQEITNRSSH